MHRTRRGSRASSKSTHQTHLAQTSRSWDRGHAGPQGTSWSPGRLHPLNHIHTLHDLAEHHVLPVQPVGDRRGDEELGAVGVWASSIGQCFTSPRRRDSAAPPYITGAALAPHLCQRLLLQCVANSLELVNQPCPPGDSVPNRSSPYSAGLGLGSHNLRDFRRTCTRAPTTPPPRRPRSPDPPALRHRLTRESGSHTGVDQLEVLILKFGTIDASAWGSCELQNLWKPEPQGE